MNFKNRFVSIRSHRLFQNTIIFFILLGALLVGIKTFEPPFIRALQVIDLIITIIFVIEIIIKLLSEKKWYNYFKSGWNWFDFIIVVGSLIPVSSDGAFIARLVRIFRFLRLIIIIPELKTLINSLLRGAKSIGYVSLLLFVIFYVYASIGSVLFSSINEDYWGNVFVALLTLFRIMTFEDWTDIMYETMQVYSFSWIFFVSFIFLTVYTFLNLFIGIIINNLQKEANKDDDIKSEIRLLRKEIRSLKK